jgi:hypothetical protein
MWHGLTVLTDGTTMGHASTSWFSIRKRKPGEILHRKMYTCVHPTPFHSPYEISHNSMCHCHLSTSLWKSGSTSHHTGLRLQLCFILNTVSPPTSLRWLLCASELPYQANSRIDFSTVKLPFGSSDLNWTWTSAYWFTQWKYASTYTFKQQD